MRPIQEWADKYNSRYTGTAWCIHYNGMLMYWDKTLPPAQKRIAISAAQQADLIADFQRKAAAGDQMYIDLLAAMAATRLGV